MGTVLENSFIFFKTENNCITLKKKKNHQRWFFWLKTCFWEFVLKEGCFLKQTWGVSRCFLKNDWKYGEFFGNICIVNKCTMPLQRNSWEKNVFHIWVSKHNIVSENNWELLLVVPKNCFLKTISENIDEQPLHHFAQHSTT